MAEDLKPHAPKPYVPKRPGQTYTVDPEGNETIVAKPTPAPRTATAPAKTTARKSGAKKTATKAAPAAAETADSETK